MAAVEIAESSWVFHPDGDDVAIAPFELESADWEISALQWESMCPTRERLVELNAGLGDEVVMVGRFIGHEGKEQNRPLVALAT